MDVSGEADTVLIRRVRSVTCAGAGSLPGPSRTPGTGCKDVGRPSEGADSDSLVSGQLPVQTVKTCDKQKESGISNAGGGQQDEQEEATGIALL